MMATSHDQDMLASTLTAKLSSHGEQLLAASFLTSAISQCLAVGGIIYDHVAVAGACCQCLKDRCE